jgi:hypothetical protein
MDAQTQDIFNNMFAPAPKKEVEKVESYEERVARMVGEKKLQKQKTRKIQKTMSKEDQAAKNK